MWSIGGQLHEWMKSINTCSCDRSVDSFVSEWKALTHVIDWLTASLPEVSGLSPTDTKVDPEWKGWFLLSTSCTVSAFCWPQDCQSCSLLTSVQRCLAVCQCVLLLLPSAYFRWLLSCCLSVCCICCLSRSAHFWWLLSCCLSVCCVAVTFSALCWLLSLVKYWTAVTFCPLLVIVVMLSFVKCCTSVHFWWCCLAVCPLLSNAVLLSVHFCQMLSCCLSTSVKCCLAVCPLLSNVVLLSVHLCQLTLLSLGFC